jgi:hypothetical protein
MTGDRQWLFCDYDESDEEIALAAVSFQISLADIYNKVKFAEVDAETASDVGEV